MRLHSAFVVFAAALVVACGGLSQRAEAAAGGFIYWSHGNTVSPQGIGRANVDGTGVNENFITGTNVAGGVAVDDQHVYWANFDSIGRANLDGTGVNQSLIPDVDNNLGKDVAVYGDYIYWTAIDDDKAVISRANVDGTGVDTDFVAFDNGALGVAVDGQHIWFTNASSVFNGFVGRANMDGTNPQQVFLQAGLFPRGIATGGGAVYWTSSRGIGRSDGADANLTFLADPFVRWVDVNGQNIFWTNARGIGRANLDGSGPNYGLISGVTQPNGIAVTPAPARTCAGRQATIVGDDGADRLSGTPHADVIVGRGGDDRVNGGGGDDLICAGSGDDRLTGGAGRDQLRGGTDKDVLLGGGGRDRLLGGPGRDREEQ